MQIRALLFDENFIAILVEYSNYNNIFLTENITRFSEHIKIIDYAIKFKKSKQLLFRPIYNLGLIVLEIFRIYIETNIVNNFIWPFKFLTKVLTFFNQKLYRNFYFCVNY